MRNKIKKPLTGYAVKLALNKLEKFKVAGEDPNAVLEQSVMNSWQGLFTTIGRNGYAEPRKKSDRLI